jgi:hypothetical protein
VDTTNVVAAMDFELLDQFFSSDTCVVATSTILFEQFLFDMRSKWKGFSGQQETSVRKGWIQRSSFASYNFAPDKIMSPNRCWRLSFRNVQKRNSVDSCILVFIRQMHCSHVSGNMSSFTQV